MKKKEPNPKTNSVIAGIKLRRSPAARAIESLWE